MPANKPPIQLLGNLAVDVTTKLSSTAKMDTGHESHPAEITLSAGGCVYNHAIAFKAVSKNARIISLCGNDQNSNMLTNLLQQTDLELSGIIHHPGKTNITNIIIDNGGDKRILYDRAPIRLDQELLQKIAEQLSNGSHLHYSLNPWVHTVLGSISKENTTLTFSTDLHDTPETAFTIPELLSNLNIIFFSGKSDPDAITMIKQLMETGPSIVLCCLGDRGCIIGEAATNKIWSMPAIPQEQTPDTVGAGDVFAATFLASHMEGADVRETVLKAQIQAGQSCTHRGLAPLYDKEKLEEEYHQYRKEYFSKISFLF